MESLNVRTLRNRFTDACKKRGFVVAVRRLIRDGDGVHFCSACFDEVYGDAGRTDCPFCYGTGFTGGYHPVELTWGDVTTASDITIEEKQGGGKFISTQGAAFLGSYPIVFKEDLLCDVTDYEVVRGVIVPRAFGSLYYIRDGVNHNTIKGKLNWHNRGECDEDTLIYQSFDVNVLVQNDARQAVPFS
jgi:hypothetical protein